MTTTYQGTHQPNKDHSDDYRYPSPAAMPALGSSRYDLRTGPERLAAQLTDAETRIEQLEGTVQELRAAVAQLTGFMHRYINLPAVVMVGGTVVGELEQ